MQVFIYLNSFLFVKICTVNFYVDADMDKEANCVEIINGNHIPMEAGLVFKFYKSFSSKNFELTSFRIYITLITVCKFEFWYIL